ncbi:MAG TPA: site-2 protease family protein [Candidatus Dormibacteraeota bacterium]|nr:site-2 protease family protein [Candidatus Dormibacteraeota bacterium]
MTVLLYIGAIVLLILVVVVVHEAGHFVFAKLSGVRVDEFAIGFGPKLLSRKLGETLYSIRAIPAGGFVRMAGMLGLQGEADAGERNFYRASIPKRLITVFAGVLFNFVFAAACFAIGNMQSTPSQVQPRSPAETAGLHAGDTILSVNGAAIPHDSQDAVTSALHRVTAAAQGQPMSVTYRGADGAQHTTTVRPELVVITDGTGAGTTAPAGELIIDGIDGKPVGTGDPAALVNGHEIAGYVQAQDGSPGKPFSHKTVAGALSGFDNANASTVAVWLMGIQAGHDGAALLPAIKDGIVAIPAFIGDTVSGLYHLITTPKQGGLNGPHGLSGPVGIAEVTVSSANGTGPPYLFWLGFVSMNLGFVNLLPIPFLDGGKILFLLIEAVRRRRLDPRHEAFAYAVGLAFVLLFAVYVTIGDVSRL